VVHLTDDPGAAVSSLLGALRRRVSEAIASADLDAHVAALILSTGHSHQALAPYGGEISTLLATANAASSSLVRSHDVAVAGCRLALGGPGVTVDEFRGAARRELHRQSLPPAATVFDDDRLLLGVAAGIGKAAPELSAELVARLRAAHAALDSRTSCLDLWSEALARCGASFDADLSRRSVVAITNALATPATLRGADRIAVIWLTARILEAGEGLGDSDLETLVAVMTEGQRSLLGLHDDIENLRSLDAVLCFDALARTPAASLARRSTIESILAVIDGFPRSVGILSNRYDHRAPFPVDDEYDMQDLLHALLIPIVPDCVREDPASKVAGKSSKLDFTSKRYRLGIEAKFVRDAKHAPKVREELLIDEATYHTHPFVDTVIAFVFDPRKAMPPAGDHAFEADLTHVVRVGDRGVRYIVRIRR